MSDLRDLYQEVIVDHSRRPRNFAKLDPCTHSADGFNPLCGDKITVYLNVDDGKISQVGFEGAGCAISTASASLLTETLKGKSAAEFETLFSSFKEMVTSDSENPTLPENLGKLKIFAGVCEYPARVKCATLCWHTVKNALEEKEELAITE